MFDKIWDLIRDEAEAVEGYFKVLEEAKEHPECAALIPLLETIIADEEDHIDALNYYYRSTGGIKPATDAMAVAKKSISSAKAVQIYKESRMEEAKE